MVNRTGYRKHAVPARQTGSTQQRHNNPPTGTTEGPTTALSRAQALTGQHNTSGWAPPDSKSSDVQQDDLNTLPSLHAKVLYGRGPICVHVQHSSSAAVAWQSPYLETGVAPVGGCYGHKQQPELLLLAQAQQTCHATVQLVPKGQCCSHQPHTPPARFCRRQAHCAMTQPVQHVAQRRRQVFVHSVLEFTLPRSLCGGNDCKHATLSATL